MTLASIRLAALCLLLSLPCAAQSAAPGLPAKPIQDNSFLLEEAYNQEFGVVQHISGFLRSWTTRQWFYSFTQEWPFDPAPRHQLSYTIPVARFGPDATGIGDVALNYRYQLVGSGDTRVAFAPRFSVLLPTGDSRRGFGSGGTGLQGNLPLSVVLSRQVVTHWNLGTTIVPRAQDPLGSHAATFGYNLGQSTIWLARERFNLMLETVYSSAQAVAGPGRTRTAHDLLISPGVRWAHNFDNGLQIVPGIAVPLGVGPSLGNKSIFLYLSFEHPYRKTR